MSNRAIALALLLTVALGLVVFGYYTNKPNESIETSGQNTPINEPIAWKPCDYPDLYIPDSVTIECGVFTHVAHGLRFRHGFARIRSDHNFSQSLTSTDTSTDTNTETNSNTNIDTNIDAKIDTKTDTKDQLDTPSPNAKRTALIFIAGGPGEGNIVDENNIDYWMSFLEEHGIKHDFILYNPRGVQGSDPHWVCKNYVPELRKNLANNIPYKTQLSRESEILRSCLQDFKAWLTSRVETPSLLDGVFSSRAQAQDPILLGRALGYKHIDLLGISYGSRVALLAAQAPEVRHVVLDAAYPFGVGGLRSVPSLVSKLMGLHRVAYSNYARKASQNKKDSTKTFLNFDELLMSAYQVLQKQTLELFVPLAVSGEDTQYVLVHEGRLFEILMFVMYDESNVDNFYKALEQTSYASEFDFSTSHPEIEALKNSWRSVLKPYVEVIIDSRFSYMTHMATECTDNGTINSQAYQDLVKDELGKDTGNTSAILQAVWSSQIMALMEYEPCGAWQSRVATIDEEGYVAKPTLIYSGEFDPVTPRAWSESLSETLREMGQYVGLVRAEGVGHGALSSWACDASILQNFLAGNEKKTEFSCRYSSHEIGAQK